MRALIQRVSHASVTIDAAVHAEISHGFLIFLGIEHEDNADDLAYLLRKIPAMRLFADAEGKMNLALPEVAGSALVVSQFTLHASTHKGNRPSFVRAAAPSHAEPLYQQFCRELSQLVPVQTGVFGADMQVSLVNDGPVTIWLDSRARE